MNDGIRSGGAGKEVFSLWPTPDDFDRSPGAAVPDWVVNRPPPNRLPVSRTEIAIGGALGVMLLGAALALIAGETQAFLWGAGAVILLIGLILSRRQRRAEAVEAHWRATLFERPGLSLWREDWTAVGEAIRDLKLAGVHDIGAWYAARPDEARALRGRVMVKDVNAFAVRMMGAGSKADLIGPLDRLLPDSDQTFDQWLVAFGRGDAFYRSETHIVRPDGSHLDCLFTAALPTTLDGFRDILVTALDVTEYKRLQTRLVEAQTEAARASRISTVGALTASIAHEVNTPLASILANVQAALRWLRRDTPNLPEAEQALDRAVVDASRTQEVVGRTRDFLSASPPDVQPIDLAETARIAAILIDRELRLHDAAVHLDAAEDLPRVMADPVQMQQVLVNLMVNGLQAMTAGPAPRDLNVQVRAVEDRVQIAVTDHGPGVAPHLRAGLFEPFISGRPGGMGMGLAICRNTVEALGGRIWLETRQGSGATFVVSLPAPGSAPDA
ncbi:MAG: ATP-binding protein [Brevundimonas sp.]|nr:ATP-binding protein [Brevundimonas sp.]